MARIRKNTRPERTVFNTRAATSKSLPAVRRPIREPSEVSDLHVSDSDAEEVESQTPVVSGRRSSLRSAARRSPSPTLTTISTRPLALRRTAARQRAEAEAQQAKPVNEGIMRLRSRYSHQAVAVRKQSPPTPPAVKPPPPPSRQPRGRKKARKSYIEVKEESDKEPSDEDEAEPYSGRRFTQSSPEVEAILPKRSLDVRPSSYELARLLEDQREWANHLVEKSKPSFNGITVKNGLSIEEEKKMTQGLATRSRKRARDDEPKPSTSAAQVSQRHSPSSRSTRNLSTDSQPVLQEAEIEEAKEYVAERVLGYRVVVGQAQVKVRWEGFTPADDSWEPLKDQQGIVGKISEYLYRSKSQQVVLVRNGQLMVVQESEVASLRNTKFREMAVQTINLSQDNTVQTQIIDFDMQTQTDALQLVNVHVQSASVELEEQATQTVDLEVVHFKEEEHEEEEDASEEVDDDQSEYPEYQAVSSVADGSETKVVFSRKAAPPSEEQEEENSSDDGEEEDDEVDWASLKVEEVTVVSHQSQSQDDQWHFDVVVRKPGSPFNGLKRQLSLSKCYRLFEAPLKAYLKQLEERLKAKTVQSSNNSTRERQASDLKDLKSVRTSIDVLATLCTDPQGFDIVQSILTHKTARQTAMLDNPQVKAVLLRIMEERGASQSDEDEDDA